MVHPAQRFYFSRKVQYRLGKGGLSRVHMGKDADYRVFSCRMELILTVMPKIINDFIFRAISVKGVIFNAEETATVFPALFYPKQADGGLNIERMQLFDAGTAPRDRISGYAWRENRRPRLR